MPADRKKLYVISILAPVLLILSYAFPDGGKIYAAVLLPVVAVIAGRLIKKRTIPSIYKGQVLMLMTVIALLYLMLYFLTGLYFGLGRTTEYTPLSILTEALPIASAVISVEYLRNILLCEKSTGVATGALIASVLLDVVLTLRPGALNSADRVMELAGIIAPSICAALLYNYLTRRYGIKPIISFRLITILYIYFIPMLPKMNDVLQVVIKTALPVVIYLFIDALYEKKPKIARKRSRGFAAVALSLSSAALLFVIAVVSCQFRFGALVIGSDSMTGELSVGDVAVYESYGDEEIDVSDVIVFNRNGSKIIHRVIKKENIDGENRYTTKGDANEDADPGYRTDSDIIGIVKLKIPYVGYPTVWLQNIFEINNEEGE